MNTPKLSDTRLETSLPQRSLRSPDSALQAGPRGSQDPGPRAPATLSHSSLEEIPSGLSGFIFIDVFNMPPPTIRRLRISSVLRFHSLNFTLHTPAGLSSLDIDSIAASAVHDTGLRDSSLLTDNFWRFAGKCAFEDRDWCYVYTKSSRIFACAASPSVSADHHTPYSVPHCRNVDIENL